MSSEHYEMLWAVTFRDHSFSGFRQIKTLSGRLLNGESSNEDNDIKFKSFKLVFGILII